MARARTAARPPQQEAHRRYTVDASVFVNAFNPHEQGHAVSLALLTALQKADDPVIVPTLLLPEVAAALARATVDSTGAHAFATALAALPHVTLVALTPTMARHAMDLAANYRLRGADAVYVAVARRYGTTVVTRDAEQRARGVAVLTCQTPEEALADRT